MATTIARCLIAFFFVASGSGNPVTGTDQIVHMIKNIIGGLLTFVAF